MISTKQKAIVVGISVLVVGILVWDNKDETKVSVNLSDAASVPTLGVSPVTSSVTNGQTFAVDVSLDTADQPVDGLDVVSLHFNPAVLQVIDMVPVNIFQNSAVTVNTFDNSTGTVKYSQISLPVNQSSGAPFIGTTKIVTVNFRAVATGSSNLTIDFTPGSTSDSNAVSVGVDKLGAVINGSVTVSPGAAINKFNIGDRIFTTAKVKVRTTPTNKGKALCTQNKNVAGTILAGPQTASGIIWWQVNYDSGCDGWSAEDWLSK